eukprot:Colp12_sorted_trinity150504_noHs@10617
MSVKSEKKQKSINELEKRIQNEDEDSQVKFSITKYTDVLDLIFYSPEIVPVLEKFGTASGFLFNVTSIKQVALDSFLKSALLGKKDKEDGTDEFEKIRSFMSKYVETQLFNGLLKNTVAADDDYDELVKKATLDPQEYFDEVAAACAKAISACMIAENVRPNLFKSSVEYSIFPISQSILRNDMLKNVGILVIMAGNIGVEKTSGSFLKKGKVMTMLDITLKVVVFNNYIYSHRGLTLVLNGIREREKRNRAELLDKEIARQANEVTAETELRYDTKVQPKGIVGKLLAKADDAVAEKVHDSIASAATAATGGLNQTYREFAGGNKLE